MSVRHLAESQVLEWLHTVCPEALSQGGSSRDPFPLRPLIVGVSGPQGSGKTTLSKQLESSLAAPPRSLSVISLSIDDFYLTKQEQDSLASSEPGNKLLQYRGNPGTHDISLALNVLDELTLAHQSALEGRPSSVLIPRYDKSLHQGRGDRAPREKWTTALAPFHVIILEGWCVGFRSLPDRRLQELFHSSNGCQIDASLESVFPCLRSHQPTHVEKLNLALKEYDGLWLRLDVLLHIHTTDLNNVYIWRKEQERSLWNLSHSGLTDQEVEDFVDRFMPGYMLGLDSLLRAEQEKTIGRFLRILIGQNRELLSFNVG
ncbi:hypothetical protein PhCBS80983_g05477 [Powellomyces hirtus]|uniref:Phosphoribulokinase/uridine kinase domain-containing protein n=1 Tax=Powellomyces hirtus TaxID=109895 RepID=A0A507DUM9_9FUNG|nr:hypothetical protein PhCBS80983_g05477 [Powellomyces hirtus]